MALIKPSGPLTRALRDTLPQRPFAVRFSGRGHGRGDACPGAHILCQAPVGDVAVSARPAARWVSAAPTWRAPSPWTISTQRSSSLEHWEPPAAQLDDRARLAAASSQPPPPVGYRNDRASS